MSTAEADASPQNGQSTKTDGLMNVMVQGKRHVMAEDFESAVQCFEEACKIVDDKFGVEADECAEAYLLYGVALLDLSRQEMGAFDGVVKTKAVEDGDQSDDEEGEEGDEEGEEEGEAENENGSGDAKAGDEKVVVPPKTPEEEATDSPPVPPAAEQSEEKPTENGDEATSAETSEKVVQLDNLDQPGTSSGVTKAKEEEEDAANTIETSYAVLKMAADIFRRQVEKGDEMKLRLAEALGKMGEIAIEWENNELAIELFNESLAIRRDVLADDDRLIAESYYHIGIAYSFLAQLDQAATCFRLAIDVIEKRIKKFEDIIKNTEYADERLKAEKELTSLKELLPDMVAKIDDSKDQMSSSKQVSQALKEEESVKKEEDSSKVDKKPATNITHLVKRKRTEAEEEQPSKKTCTVEASSEKANP